MAPDGNLDILVVEDRATQARILRDALESQHWTVRVARDGERGLQLAAEHAPDLILSDIVMPVMDGYELCRQIKANPATRGIPVALLTSLSDPEDVLKGLACGADQFLTKPYSEAQLFSRVRFIQANYRHRRDFLPTAEGVEIMFAGQAHVVTAGRMQILDLLLSTYESAVAKNHELERVNRELRQALDDVKTLRGMIPICAQCKKIRDDQGFWTQVETYVTARSDAKFTHGLCPRCAEEFMRQASKL